MSEITDKDLEVWIEEANSVLNSGGSHVSAASTILALCEHIQQCRRADPVADVVAWHREGEERTCDIRWRRHDVAPGPLYAVPQSPVTYPQKLPCPVRLEPWLLFGKGVPTSTMLDALQRRAEYHEELESMTPEEREEREQNIKAFKAALETGQAFSPFEEVSIEELQCRYPPKPDQQ